MIDFYDGQITDLLPDNIKENAAVQAISYALREGTRLLYRYTQLCYVYCSIDTMPDKILDLLAVELRTQYYSDTFDVETKRALVRNTLLWYMTAGTPAAVEELVAVVFGEGEVSEWYEYGGEPYWFKITTNAILTEDMIAYFSEMIRRVKNTRSHIGAIEIHRTVELIFYCGCGGLSMYKPPAVIDGYDIERAAEQAIYAGAASEPIYKPAAIIDGYKTGRETAQIIYAGAGAFPAYKPGAVFEDLKETAQAPASDIFVGIGYSVRETHAETIREN